MNGPKEPILTPLNLPRVQKPDEPMNNLWSNAVPNVPKPVPNVPKPVPNMPRNAPENQRENPKENPKNKAKNNVRNMFGEIILED